jgi:hypothetical protein
MKIQAFAYNSCAWNSFLKHTKIHTLANELVSVCLLLRCSHCTDRRCWPLAVTMETRVRVISPTPSSLLALPYLLRNKIYYGRLATKRRSLQWDHHETNGFIFPYCTDLNAAYLPYSLLQVECIYCRSTFILEFYGAPRGVLLTFFLLRPQRFSSIRSLPYQYKRILRLTDTLPSLISVVRCS